MWPSASPSSSRRRAGSTSSRRSWARTSARASSAREQRLELLERHAEQVFQAHHLAQPLDLGLACRGGGWPGGPSRAPRGAGRSPRSSGSSAAWCRPGARRRRSAGCWRRASAGDGRRAHRAPAAGGGRRIARGCARSATAIVAASARLRRPRRARRAARALGRSRQTPAPSSETAASTHSATCMLAMNGASFSGERPLARPEKTANSVAFGTAEVTIASTNAIDSTAPVFCSSVRAPAAMPRRCGGHGAHHRGRVGAVEHARADADDRQPQARSASRGCGPRASSSPPARRRSRACRARPARASRGGRRRCPASGEAMSMPSASGISLMPASIGELPWAPW